MCISAVVATPLASAVVVDAAADNVPAAAAAPVTPLKKGGLAFLGDYCPSRLTRQMKMMLASASAALGCMTAGAGALVEHGVEGACQGWGLQPFIDVTVPHSASWGEAVAVLYSFVPWAVALAVIFAALYRKTSTLVAGVMYISFVVSTNEVLIKRNFPQSRPIASCLVSPGMPSSHSIISIGLLVWTVLELAERGSQARHVVAAAAVLLPVPASRVVLNDHSYEQVMAGSLFGVSTALFFFAFMKYSAAKSLHEWCKKPWVKRLGITNDYHFHLPFGLTPHHTTAPTVAEE